MDNKKILALLFISGMILGAGIVLAMYSLNIKLASIELAPPAGEKNLCEILTKEYLQERFPHLFLESSASVSAENSGGANCLYYSEDSDEPLLTFFYSDSDLDALKEQRRPFEATFKDISGIGDEAFFSELRLPEEILFNSIFFRVGNFGYFLESLKLSESELGIIAAEAVSKLR